MIATVTKMTIDTILFSTFDMLATAMELISITILCVLLAEKELIRVYNRIHLRPHMRVLNIVTVPLLMAFGLIVIKNLLNFLEYLK